MLGAALSLTTAARSMASGLFSTPGRSASVSTKRRKPAYPFWNVSVKLMSSSTGAMKMPMYSAYITISAGSRMPCATNRPPPTIVAVYNAPVKKLDAIWNWPMKRYESSFVSMNSSLAWPNLSISICSLPNPFTTRMPPSESCKRAFRPAIRTRFWRKIMRLR